MTISLQFLFEEIQQIKDEGDLRSQLSFPFPFLLIPIIRIEVEC
jgi:hypothetical protein